MTSYLIFGYLIENLKAKSNKVASLPLIVATYQIYCNGFESGAEFVIIFFKFHHVIQV